jgi:PIN domain nuclease of toxin-antitoxin system
VKLLFDTHAFIWWDGDQSKLSAAALAACESMENTPHLSLASVWELQIKMQLGKFALRLSLANVRRDQQHKNGLVLEPVTLKDILALSALPALHRDPFDRLIIAPGESGRLSSRHSRSRTCPLSSGGVLVNGIVRLQALKRCSGREDSSR